MAVIRVQGDEMIVEGTVPPTVLAELQATKQRALSPSIFLKSLPTVFSGSYLRAQMVTKEPIKKTEDLEPVPRPETLQLIAPVEKPKKIVKEIIRDERGLITRIIETEE
jgi:hypothetical protein